MTTFTIEVRGHGKVYQWQGVTAVEMERLIVAMGASPDAVDDDGNMIVEFVAGRRYGNLPHLTPELVYQVLRRPAFAWNIARGPRGFLFPTEESEGHGGF